VPSVGGSSLQEDSVRSVPSVGEPLLAWLVQQRLLHPLRLHLWEAIPRMRVRGYGKNWKSAAR